MAKQKTEGSKDSKPSEPEAGEATLVVDPSSEIPGKETTDGPPGPGEQIGGVDADGKTVPPAQDAEAFKLIDEMKAEHDAEIAKLREEHDEALSLEREKHAAEIAKLREELAPSPVEPEEVDYPIDRAPIHVQYTFEAVTSLTTTKANGERVDIPQGQCFPWGFLARETLVYHLKAQNLIVFDENGNRLSIPGEG